MKANILVYGNDGVGKTSLIKKMIGNLPVNELKIAANNTEVYETELVNYYDCQACSSDEKISDYIGNLKSNCGNYLENFDAVWYCLDGSEIEQNFDENLFSFFNNRIVAVITKCDEMNSRQIKNLYDLITKYISSKQVVLTVNHRPVPTKESEENGLSRLINVTRNLLIKNIHNTSDVLKKFEHKFMEIYNERMDDFSKKEEQCAKKVIVDFSIFVAAHENRPNYSKDSDFFAIKNAIYHMAAVYGFTINDTIIDFIVKFGDNESIISKFTANFTPFAKCKINYAIIIVAKAYFASDMTLGSTDLQKSYLQGKKIAQTLNWQRLKNAICFNNRINQQINLVD
ncbi:MAG: GTPase domain-containing protein [Lentisphaeria bacterium]